MSTKTKSDRVPHSVIPPRGVGPQQGLVHPGYESEETTSADRLSDAAPAASGLIHDFGQIRVHLDQPRSAVAQAKLSISQPNDRYEQEADRVAEMVMRMPEPYLLPHQVEEKVHYLKPPVEQITPLIQRQKEEEKTTTRGTKPAFEAAVEYLKEFLQGYEKTGFLRSQRIAVKSSFLAKWLANPKFIRFLQNLYQLPGPPGAIRARPMEIYENIRKRKAIETTAKKGSAVIAKGLEVAAALPTFWKLVEGAQWLGVDNERSAAAFAEAANIPGAEKLLNNLTEWILFGEEINIQEIEEGRASLIDAVTMGLPKTINLFVDLAYELAGAGTTLEEERFRMDPSVLSDLFRFATRDLEEDMVIQGAYRNSSRHISIQSDKRLEDQIRSMQGSGVTLPEESRDFFEPRFGVDLQDVRIHTDEEASEAAQSINAKAFTIGRDIFFSKGEYRPGDFSGKELLVHELVHVVQQSGYTRRQPVFGQLVQECANKDGVDAVLGHQSSRQQRRDVLAMRSPGPEEKKEAFLLNPKVVGRITILEALLRERGVRADYIADSSGEIRYRLYDPFLKETRIYSNPHNLLKDLEVLKTVYSIKELRKHPQDTTPPYWLTTEARKFWNRAIRHELPADGEYAVQYAVRCGRPILLTYSTLLIDKMYNTREQVIWVRLINGRTEQIQAFQYRSTEQYKDDLLKLKAAEEINYLMYHYVEEENMSPERARERIKAEAAEALKLTLILFAQAFVGA